MTCLQNQPELLAPPIRDPKRFLMSLLIWVLARGKVVMACNTKARLLADLQLLSSLVRGCWYWGLGGV